MSHQMMQRDTREGPRPPSAQFSFRLQSQFRAAMPRWSLYGAPWSQPAAISRKSSEPQDRKNKPNPLPPGATGWLRPSMVRRGSPVRVRKRACKEAASRSFSFRLDLHDCQRTVGVEHFMEPSGQNAVVKRDDFARSASTRSVARGDGSTCRARAPLGSAPTSDLKGRRRKLKDIDARKRAAHQRLELAVHRSRWFVGLRCCRAEGHQRTNRADGFHGRRGVANPSGYPSLRKPPGRP